MNTHARSCILTTLLHFGFQSSTKFTRDVNRSKYNIVFCVTYYNRSFSRIHIRFIYVFQSLTTAPMRENGVSRIKQTRSDMVFRDKIDYTTNACIAYCSLSDLHTINHICMSRRVILYVTCNHAVSRVVHIVNRVLSFALWIWRKVSEQIT